MNNKILLIVGALVLLGGGIYGGTLINKNPETKEENIATVTGIPTNVEPSPTATVIAKGTISGFLTYPSSGIPPEVGVCAQNISSPTIINCVKQIKDKRMTQVSFFELFLQVFPLHSLKGF